MATKGDDIRQSNISTRWHQCFLKRATDFTEGICVKAQSTANARVQKFRNS
jgi:hypothetical protein